MKTLIADDHALFRAGIRHLLDNLVERPSYLEAASIDEVCGALAAVPDIDLLLLDLDMPGMSGPADIASLADANPNVLIVVVSGSESRADVLEAINSGAVGYIPKASSPQVMAGALQLVLAGGVYLPPMLLDRQRGGGKPASGPGQPSLTPRQHEVLAHLARGRSNKEIARELNLSVSAIKLHVASILDALDASNRTEAAQIAVRQGLVAGR